MNRKAKLRAMLASDAACDGRFLTGVMSTGIYCLPSCRARKPKAENVRFFAAPARARAAGLRACKRCRPDDFHANRDPDRDRLRDLVDRLRERPSVATSVGELAALAGMGSSKLGELFRQHYHASAAEFLARARVEAACRLLAEGEAAIAEAAFATGHGTLSAFNQGFRARTGMTPSAYRAMGRDALEASCAGGRSEGCHFQIALPKRYQAGRALAHLGRDAKSASEQVAGLSFALTLDLCGDSFVIEGRIAEDHRSCRLTLPGGLPKSAIYRAHEVVLGFLALKIDPRPFERRILAGPHRDLVVGRLGLGIPQTRDPFDGLIWVIAGQQVSLAVAYGMRRRLTRLLGRPARFGSSSGSGSFGAMLSPPGPAAVAELEAADLHAIGYSRRKAEYLLDASRAIVSGELDLASLTRAPATEVSKRLLAVRGLGPWSVNYLMMRAYALADCVPIGDAGLARALQEYFSLPERPKGQAMGDLMLPFASYRSLATFHLWASL